MMGRWLVAAASLALLAACGSDRGRSDKDGTDAPDVDAPGTGEPGEDPAEIARKLSEKPWEVVSNKGETYLPNVFYADASENEQIMPYAVDGHVMIDRLVYPTLGNPNLYTKSDAKDELVVVLRIEDAAFAHLGAKIEPVAGSHLSKLVVPNDASTGFGFFLIPRGAREPNTESTTAISSGKGTDVVRVYPNEIFVNPEPDDMPAVLKKRKTLRFVFRQGAMAKAPAGLYDLRFEVKKDNELYRPAAGAPPVYEYQFNAVRVFDAEPDEYSVVNVTDTQVSVGDVYDAKTKDKLDEFVQFMNTTNDPAVRNASFITFNGDLHNGGSPGSLRQRTVAWTYEEEAKSIVALLKYLPLPIFLTTGNHDGYVSTGHVPSAVKALDTGLGESLREVIIEASPKAWPDFSVTQFDSYIQKTEAADRLGGVHRDIFTGGFARTGAASLAGFDGWKEIPRADRNLVLYDGFYQWQKTYGPLYYSHKFGKSFYLSLNSFELRQHRRTGWGMYTVNYGGGMSDVQMAWLDRELLRARIDENDVVVLAHHDPRGGHKGKDPGYYFEQLEYRSVYQSAINYLVGKVWNPAVCKLPDWALSRDQNESCVHDGLQEWMRADPEFDCGWDERKTDFTCKPGTPYASGVELMKRLSASANVRTMLLGHTHYNALEILQEGDELLPGQFPVGSASSQKFATLEVQNPLRGFSELQSGGALADYDHHALGLAAMETRFADFVSQYEKSVAGWQRTLAGSMGPRELVVLRLVSNADLASQTYSNGKNALGFSVLFLDKKSDPRGVVQAQINRAKFFANVGAAKYDTVGTIDIDRTARLRPHDPENPVEKLFDW
ncbi:MAG: metallophosphoesterase [Labilithrix sp.]|nr:metallophosphoesterase [Labilithrix sp.]